MALMFLTGDGMRGGQPILGELYDVPMSQLHDLLGSEPPELELSVVVLAPGEPAPGGPAGGQAGAGDLSFGMILRRGEREHSVHADITRYGGWRAYRESR